MAYPKDGSNSSASRRSFLKTSSGLMALGMLPPCLVAQGQPAPDECVLLAQLTAEWKPLRQRLAGRYHRLNHFLFHILRNTWDRLSDEKREDIAGMHPGWLIQRPALTSADWDRDNPYRGMFWTTSNASGEDFLYYHRWMLAEVNGWLTELGLGQLRSWSGDTLPAPGGGSGCADEVVPEFTPVIDIPGGDPLVLPFLQTRVREVKSDRFYWSKMVWWEQQFRDRSYLETLSLGELGSRLERSIHNQMHIRWSDYPRNSGITKPLVRSELDIDAKWDHPDYDTLFDEYSSHVNPLFFRLHVWLDNRVNDWADAQGSTLERYDTGRGFEWFRPGRHVQLETPWVGANGFTPQQPGRIAEMEKVVDILRGGGDAALVGPAPDARGGRVITLRDMF